VIGVDMGYSLVDSVSALNDNGDQNRSLIRVQNSMAILGTYMTLLKTQLKEFILIK